MKVFSRLMTLLLMSTTLWACQDQTCEMKAELDALYKMDIPFDMPAYQLPEIPDYQVNLKDFGGNGSGVVDNTKAFADAIAHINAKGGGTLLVEPGIYLTGPIEFVSNFCLNLQRGAVVLFTTDHSKYDLQKTTFEGLTAIRCKHPISGENLENIAIVGEGVIDGQGDSCVR